MHVPPGVQARGNVLKPVDTAELENTVNKCLLQLLQSRRNLGQGLPIIMDDLDLNKTPILYGNHISSILLPGSYLTAIPLLRAFGTSHPLMVAL